MVSLRLDKSGIILDEGTIIESDPYIESFDGGCPIIDEGLKAVKILESIVIGLLI